MLIRQGKADEALQLGEHMMTGDELAGEARIVRADALLSLGKPSLALRELDAAIQAAPDNVELLERRCRVLFEHFPPSDAEPGFRELIARDPQNASACHNLGSVLYKLGRFDESAISYRESLRLRPNSASTYLHLGYAHREAGRIQEATAAWEEALKLSPEDPLAKDLLRQAREQNYE